MIKFVFILSTTAIFTSCSLNRGSIPMVQPTPLFEQQGDFYLVASHQSERGFNLQSGGAVSKNLSVIAVGTYGQKDNCFSCSKEVARHIEMGVGTYGVSSKYFVDEVFIGGGVGNLRLINSQGWDPSNDDITIFSSEYFNGFIQTDVGSNGKVFDRIFFRPNWNFQFL